MAKSAERSKVIELRLKGLSYSQIKDTTGISKATLSGWLSRYPLSVDRIKQLRDRNPRRIESFRNTMRYKREARLAKVLARVSEEIGVLSSRELLLAGLFLYWGEGGKTQRFSIAFTNTNPAMLKFFIKWVKTLGVDIWRLKVKLHIYADMVEESEIDFWIKELGLKRGQFRKTYVKKSKVSEITYKNGFGHGTCSLIYDNRDICEYVLSGVKYLESLC